ncbi:hypothetical protein B0T22DRAFT_380006 [Podospora appendiculata]|uniref:Uncharacterized protein n=1 Tax=Podospora appendiculata TaxID=314037 RepID=A0AAE0X7Y3_9PEZI|nr:hypothetical protein B0T22DRAFT_380006 [Podospora appendiculata]
MSSHDYEGWRVFQSSYVPVTHLYPAGQGTAPELEESQYRNHFRRSQDTIASAGRSSSPSRKGLPNYRPAPLRWPFLGALVVVILVFLSLVGMACHVLPAEVDRSFVPQSESSSTAGSQASGTSALSPLLRPRSWFYPKNGTAIDPLTQNLILSTSTSGAVAQAPTMSTTSSSSTASESPISSSHILSSPAISTTLSTASEPLIGSEHIPTTPSTARASETATSVATEPLGSDAMGNHESVGSETTTPALGDNTPVVTTIRHTTTLDGVLSTETGQATLTMVRVFTAETTLAAVVSSFTKVRTLDGLVSVYDEVATQNGVIPLVRPSYVPAQVLTMKDSDGVPTATVTSTPPPFFTPTLVTLAGPNGVPTATISTSVIVESIISFLTNSAGIATATVTVYPTYPSNNPIPQKDIKVSSISKGQYFVGFFLPPLLSTLLMIPIRVVDLSAKQFQPWHALTSATGAPAQDSLCLRSNGVYGLVPSVRSLFGGQALVLLTTLLILCSALLVPLSAEAIALKLDGSCSEANVTGCATNLGVFLGPARGAISLLGVMAVLVAIIIVVMRRWRSGVATNPWTVAGIASLSTNPEVKAVFSSLPTGREGRIRHSQLSQALADRKFKLGYFTNHDGNTGYGIMVHSEMGSLLRRSASNSSSSSELDVKKNRRKERHLPFLMLSYASRICFLLLLTGVVIVTLYYNIADTDSPFETFMETPSSGARALFTSLGVVISFFWNSFFAGESVACKSSGRDKTDRILDLAVLSPFVLLSRAPQSAQRSVLLSPPTSALMGARSAIEQRNLPLVVVAFMAILSDFMPMLLNNVPLRMTQAWMTHLVCTWLAVAMLGVMWLVVVGSFFVTWPHMPVDPRTIAGAMFYVCDSRMVLCYEGLGVLGKKERDGRVDEMGLKFQFGDIVGLSGRKRIGVDALHDQT